MKSILNLANHSKLYEFEKSCLQMATPCCIFVLSRIVMPPRGPKCLKIYYSRLEDRALTKELLNFFGSSPRAKNLIKRVVNRVIPAATLLHAPPKRRPFQISPQRAVELVFDLQIRKQRRAMHQSMQFQNCNQNCISPKVAFLLRISNLHQSCITTW